MKYVIRKLSYGQAGNIDLLVKFASTIEVLTALFFNEPVSYCGS